MNELRTWLSASIRPVAFLAFFTSFALAQTTTGEISGTVEDSTGSVIPTVAVSLLNQETGVTVEQITDDQGYFVFSTLRPGMYSVVASKEGFERITAKDVKVQIGQHVRLPLTMKVGTVSNSVEVTTAAVVLDTATSAIGQVVGTKTIEELPLNGRNFMQLVQLAPAVLPAGTGNDVAGGWTQRKDTQAVISGNRLEYISYLLDGVESRSARWGQPVLRPSIDAIQEFRVQQNTFSAEFGFNAVAINTALKSGTNDFHGSLFEFIRNQHLDARNFFDVAGKSGFRQNNFGVAGGGPIKRNKLFFFGDYEGLRQRLLQVQRGFYPETQWFQGDFSNLRYANGSLAPVYDATNNQPYAGNQIPQSRMSANAQKLMQYSPAPNVVGDTRWNTVKLLSDPWDWDQYHIRVDHAISSRDAMFYRYSGGKESLFRNTVHPLAGGSYPQTARNAAVSETHTFSPTLINEARFGYNHAYTGRLPEAANGPDIAKEIGFRNVTTIPESFGPPRVNLTGLTSFGDDGRAIFEVEDQLHVANNVSWTRGRHLVKFGGDYRKFFYQQATTGWEKPAFSFSGQFSVRPDALGAIPRGAAVADFVQGHVFDGRSGDGKGLQDMRAYFLGFFAQDDIRVSRTLTLNLGLRYEVLPAPRDINDRMQYFDFDARRLRVFGEPGSLTRLFPTDRNNFAPRFGFAYNPRNGRTVIRGGYGVYYAQPHWNDFHLAVWGPPFYAITSVFSDQNRPTLSLDNLFNPFDLAFSWLNSNDNAARSTYVQQWSFNIQREITNGLLVELGYQGSTTKKVQQRRNANPAFQDPTGSIPIANRRLYPGLGDILYSGNNGMANYNAATLKVEKRYSSGLQFLASYTFSKAIDLGHTDNVAAQGLNQRLERGLSVYNAAQRFVFSGLYELPFGRGKQFLSKGLTGRLLEGWQANTITTFMTGQPRTITYTGRTPQVGIYGGARPNRVADANCGECRSNIRENNLREFFRTSAFTFPAAYTFGDSDRTPVNGPGLNNWDISILKTTSITESHRLQFRAELFNAFNHAQFLDIGTALGTPTFGQVLSARTARNIQFGLKYIF